MKTKKTKAAAIESTPSPRNRALLRGATRWPRRSRGNRHSWRATVFALLLAFLEAAASPSTAWVIGLVDSQSDAVVQGSPERRVN